MNSRREAIRTLILGGILPIVAYTIVEERWGPFWGLILGMTLGTIEIGFEWLRHRRISTLTWMSNLLILVLGGVSLASQNGIWFKLQPAIIEALMGLALLITSLFRRPLLVLLATKQGAFDKIPPHLAPKLRNAFSGMNFRIGLFFIGQSFLATYAAFYWSTRAWALLKGVGFTASLLLYMVAEVFVLRRRLSGP